MRNRATNQLAKAKVRQSWSKYNLYNLSRIAPLPFRTQTYFQQKWAAKSRLRAYHSEQVREGQWERMFSRRLRAVVPMQPNRLALDDGQRESSGRGSGLHLPSARAPQSTPYMQMTFAPLERRLDTAIFRALFASSARQARQFVVHGLVKVNGKKMTYPGYLLNPGDMFQVDPDMVMYATGAPKEDSSSTKVKAGIDTEGEISEAAEGGKEAAAAEESQKEEDADADEEGAEDDDPRETLKKLLSQAKSILKLPRDTIPAKRKQDLRAFQKAIRRTLARSSSSTVLTDSLEAQFLEIKNQLRTPKGTSSLPSDQKPNTEEPKAQEDADASKDSAEEAADGSEDSEGLMVDASPDELEELRQALTLLKDNPIDPSKPYYTPWRPREYMSAFAFIPRYLEVNQNICAAVYLRHPVARPGRAEVPTPFMESASMSAFTWYLKRR